MKKLIYLMMVLVLAACAKDKDSDQYKDELVQKEFAKIQAAEGTYTGLLTNKKGQPLGALEIILKASTQVVSSGDPSGNGVQPVLISSIKLMTNRVLKLNSTTGTYINGKYDMNLSFQRSDNKENATFSLSANISDGIMTGHMEVLGYEEDGASFNLNAHGDSVEQVNQLNKSHFVSSDSGKAVIGKYLGYVEPYPNMRKKVSMQVTYPASSSSEGLTDLLYTPSERFLNVSWVVLNDSSSDSGHSDGVSFSFTQVKWDPANGTLDVTEPVTGHDNQSVMVTFSCTNFYFETQKYSFTCSYGTSSIQQPVTLVFSSANAKQ